MSKTEQRRYYVTGDCHRSFEKIAFFCRVHHTSKSDYMIVLGDAGINFNLDESDQELKQRLSELPISFLFIHGNHEQRPFLISGYKEQSWNGGTVYVEPLYPSLMFAKDGEIYDFNGKSGIAVGGAYSADKYYRIQNGYPWFESEQPSEEIKEYVDLQLEKCNWSVDYVFSHTCPKYIMPTDLLLKGYNLQMVDYSTEIWLEKLSKKLHFDKWYYGHFHENRLYCNYEMLYEEIKELGSDDFLQRLGRPRFSIGEQVAFVFDNGNEQVENIGKIEIVDSWGTMGQCKEVSYDILCEDKEHSGERVLFKHIEESKIARI